MRILTFILGTFIILILAFLMFVYFLPQAPKAEINGHVFSLYLAKTAEEQSIGLAKYKEIDMNQGMLFLFQKPDYYSFWMRNMKFPIDIIYINNDTIVTIENNAQPPKNDSENPTIYDPTKPADKVLEIQAGLSKKYKFKNGDKVKYENLSN